MRQIPALFSFNHGMISPLGLARTDQKRAALAAETMTNWVARILGSMSFRPGLGYLGSTSDNQPARFIPFVFSTTDTALIELTEQALRIWIDDVVVTRPAVSTAVTNGDFGADVTGWTDADEAGATSDWSATGGYVSPYGLTPAGLMRLVGNGTAFAIRRQQVTVSVTDKNIEHGLRIAVAGGPVILRVGSTSGSDDYISEVTLDTGEHCLTFTPTGSFWVEFKNRNERYAYIDSCNIENSGGLTFGTPFLAADLGFIRHDQSGDIIYLACGKSTDTIGYKQLAIERRAAHSWSIVYYRPDDGPFRIENITTTTLTASAITGNITLTASSSVFKSTHVGSLFRHVSVGPVFVVASVTAQNTFTSSIQVTETGTIRTITILISGSWVATVTLQYSTDNATWVDVPAKTWVSVNATTSYLDGLDNQTIYYRLGVKTGDYTSGTVGLNLSTSTGSITGIVRVTAFTNSMSVSAEVLKAIGNTTATSIWAEGQWSDYRGHPTSVRFHEGRLWWAGRNAINGSVSDGFYSFDDTVVGDSGPINRTIGSGPVDDISWILSLQRMVVGAQGAEMSARSSALDSPLTPTDFSLKVCSTQGSSSVEPGKIDLDGIFVDRTGIKVYKLAFDLRNYLYPDYSSSDLTAIVPELGLPGIVRLVIQRKPDTRIHCVRSDGIVMLAIFDSTENVLCWQLIQTDGLIVDACVLPAVNGSTEDQVYYAVTRTINGSSVLYLEKWAKETECRGGTLNKQADSFVTFTNSPSSTTVGGLSHLIGESVVVWADGACVNDDNGDIKLFTVSGSGTITLDTAALTGVVGKSYMGQWKSAKLGLQPSETSTLLTQQKRISHVGLVAAYLHAKGIQYGADFDHLNDLPEVEQGAVVSPNTVRTAYDEQEFPFPGTWLTDARLCLEATAPRPATILAVAVDLEVHN